jgi:oligosaccharide repeat unit polymerase
MNILIRYLLLFGSLLLFGAGVIFEEPMLLLVATLFIFAHNITYSVKQFYERILFLCFNVTFFIFLIGRLVVAGIFDYTSTDVGMFGTAFEDVTVVNTIITSLYLSLIALFIGYTLIQKFKLNFLDRKKEMSSGYLNSLRVFSLAFFYFCMIFRLIYVYQMKQTAVTEGYFESFMTFQSTLPSILVRISEMYDVALFAYLATMPTKKKSLFPILLYLGEGLFSAMAGRRSILMLNLLIVFIYYCIRSIRKEDNQDEQEVEVVKERKWLGKFEYTLAAIGLPILLAFMTFIGKLRTDFSGGQQSSSFKDSILEFFYSQGISVNLIGYTKIYESYIPKGKLFTFGPLMEFVDNKIIRPFQGLPEYLGQTAERAMNGHLFAHTLTYIIMPGAYLLGYGYGSSFVAELYNDFGLMGVFFGSIVYGAIIYVIFYMIRNSHYVLIIFALMMARSILFAPRGAALSFIVSSFSMPKIAAVLFILIGAKLMYALIGNRRFALR